MFSINKIFEKATVDYGARLILLFCVSLTVSCVCSSMLIAEYCVTVKTSKHLKGQPGPPVGDEK